jgi:hypothetical protein
MVEAASPRPSIHERNSSMCARLAASTAIPLSAALEEAPQVMPIGLERPAAVAGKKRDRSKLRLIDLEADPARPSAVAPDSMVVVMAGPPRHERTSQPAAVTRRVWVTARWPSCQSVATNEKPVVRAMSTVIRFGPSASSGVKRKVVARDV